MAHVPTIYSRVELGCNVGVVRDILGLAIPVTVGGVSGEVHLPNTPSSRNGLGLAAPTVVPPSRDRDEWGIVTAWRGDAALAMNITAVAFTAECCDTENSARRYLAALPRWWEIARGWLEVASGQALTEIGYAPTVCLNNPNTVWSLTTDGAEVIPVSNHVELTPGTTTHSVDEPMIRSAFDAASAGVELPLAWTLARDARSLAHAGQFRRAIIDAATGAEVAIKKLLSDRNLPTNGTLGRVARRLEESNYSQLLPSAFIDEVVNVRNDATHLSEQAPGKANPDFGTYETCVIKAAEVIEHALPLPSGLVRDWWDTSQPTFHRLFTDGGVVAV